MFGTLIICALCFGAGMFLQSKLDKGNGPGASFA